MWEYSYAEQPTLWLRIFSKEMRLFNFILDKIDSTGPANLAIEENFKIPNPTQERLGEFLHLLIKDPAEAVHCKRFESFGRVLYELVLPDSIKRALKENPGVVRLEVSDIGIPWELLHDGISFLCLKRPISRKYPEEKYITPDRDASVTTTGPLRVLIVANPEGNLPSAEEEAIDLDKLFKKNGVTPVCLIGPEQAHWDLVMESFALMDPEKSFHIVHLAGHVGENPADKSRPFGAFLLSDNKAIYPDEVIRTFKSPDTFVFLNACRTHSVEHENRTKSFNRRLGQARSLVSAFLGATGCKGAIGTMWWVVDDVAKELSLSFYKFLLAGHTVGDAMLKAKQKVSRKSDPALWASYIHYGQPGIALASVKHRREKTAKEARGRKTKSSDNFKKERKNKADSWNDNKTASGTLDEFIFEMPLDSSAKIVMARAFADQQEMQWPQLSSIHLLMGMVHFDGGEMNRLLKEIGINPDRLIEETREIFKKPEGELDQTGQGKTSSNVNNILRKAQILAKKKRRAAIGEPDLTLAVLSMRGSGAYLVLDMFIRKLGSKKLGSIADPILARRHFKENGELDYDLLSEASVLCIKHAGKEASELKWDKIHSPHLFLGVLARDNSTVAEFAAQKHVAVKRLVVKMRAYLQRENESLVFQKLDSTLFSTNALRYLTAAVDLAEEEGKTITDEGHIWRAILEDPDSASLKLLQNMGLSPITLFPVGW